MEQAPNPEKISPTAKMVAYLRTFSDIPYAKEISDLSGSEAVFNEIVGDQREQMIKFAPMLEARFKVVSKIIEQHGLKNVVEVASGVSSRGLSMTEDPSINYLATDLPTILEEKRKIINQIIGTETKRPNLALEPLNILHTGELKRLAGHFIGPVAVIHEGLLNYLTREEKLEAAKNVHDLLATSGGAWITPDFSLRTDMERILSVNEFMRSILEKISGLTERNLDTNTFTDQADVDRFFAEAGFQAKALPQLGVISLDDLSSIKNLDLDKDRVGSILATRQVYVAEAI